MDILSSGLLQRALLEVVILGATCGALGVWLLQLHHTYAAESLAHAMLPGLVIAALLGAPLLLGAAALWLVTLLDVRRMSAGEPDLLNARVLLWLVVAVLGLAMAGAAASVAALRG